MAVNSNREFKYIGFFVDREEVLRELEERGLAGRHLYRMIEHFHVTVEYRPGDHHEELFGRTIELTAFAYANDGSNEGVAVRMRSQDPDLQRLADRVAIPHITISVAEGGESVNTGKLDFEPMEPFILKGVFGGFDVDKNGPVTEREAGAGA